MSGLGEQTRYLNTPNQRFHQENSSLESGLEVMSLRPKCVRRHIFFLMSISRMRQPERHEMVRAFCDPMEHRQQSSLCRPLRRTLCVRVGSIASRWAKRARRCASAMPQKRTQNHSIGISRARADSRLPIRASPRIFVEIGKPRKPSGDLRSSPPNHIKMPKPLWRNRIPS
jgi:hypothetical protein